MLCALCVTARCALISMIAAHFCGFSAIKRNALLRLTHNVGWISVSHIQLHTRLLVSIENLFYLIHFALFSYPLATAIAVHTHSITILRVRERARKSGAVYTRTREPPIVFGFGFCKSRTIISISDVSTLRTAYFVQYAECNK